MSLSVPLARFTSLVGCGSAFIVRRHYTIIIMKITDHLDTIEKLVLDRVSPAEIRGHIQAIREQLEAYQKEAEQAPDYKKQIADLQAENTKLKAKPKAAIQVIKRRSPFDKLGTT